MILVLDNAESILDPQGTSAREIYSVVEELSQFETICLCVTSRTSTIPQYCKRPVIPTLSMEFACDIFYDIYHHKGRSETISNLLRRLDFHALSITLLATIASHNMWSHDRLAQEWDTHRTRVLRTDYNESLAATIELLLASPTFCELGPEARDLLGVVAFFPQGINEDNVGWLFPTISDRTNIFDEFRNLSLTHRSVGFITMPASLRDYLCPKDPMSSPLLRATKECYFNRLSVKPNPNKPGFRDTKWITSEDANVEHLLDVFTTIDAGSDNTWSVCGHFIAHLRFHKPRLVVLGPKIEGLPDDHPLKPWCLSQLAQLIHTIGKSEESKRLLIHTLELWRGRGNNLRVARTLRHLSDVNRVLGLHEEEVEQAKEALEVFEQHNDTSRQGKSLHDLAWLWYKGGQSNAAEKAALQTIDLLSDTGNHYYVCDSHRILGSIYQSKGETKKAINHFETALEIALSLNWLDPLFEIHCSLALLFSNQLRFDDAHTHIQRAKSYAINAPQNLRHAMELQAMLRESEDMFEDAKSVARRAIDMIYEKMWGTVATVLIHIVLLLLILLISEVGAQLFELN